jgi:HTH-type transcriptional regulator, competence development regulator
MVYAQREVSAVGSALGDELRSVRQLKGFSLKAVADPAGISTAYLQKLETGDVKNPSPNVLHGLARVLEVSYPTLMELAGYVMPNTEDPGAPRAFDYALSSTDLTDEERRAVAAFVAHLRESRTD